MSDNIDVDGVVDGFLRNDREMLAGSISDFHGRTFVHLRIYVPSAVEEGEWVRTEKGVAIPVNAFPEICQAVRRLWDLTGTNVLCARVPRNSHEEIRVGMNEFRGNVYCFIRTYYIDEAKEWKPTKKGISIATSRLEDLDELLTKLEVRLSELSLI
jgi:hypothetical protein